MTTTTATQVATRIDALAHAVWNGASNPSLIKRANRLADDLDGLGLDRSAQQLRAALTRRGESLGVRYNRVQAILADVVTATTDA